MWSILSSISRFILYLTQVQGVGEPCSDQLKRNYFQNMCNHIVFAFPHFCLYFLWFSPTVFLPYSDGSYKHKTENEEHDFIFIPALQLIPEPLDSETIYISIS